MSSCDETQKLKLKNTLNSSSSSATFPTQRERYRSNFGTKNSSVIPQQYSTIQYHPNTTSKVQKSSYQLYTTKNVNPIDHDLRNFPLSSRPYPSEANNFNGKYNSNFNNNTSVMSNSTNISSKRLLEDTRQYPNTQEKLNKWHSNSKKSPYGKITTLVMMQYCSFYFLFFIFFCSFSFDY